MVGEFPAHAAEQIEAVTTSCREIAIGLGASGDAVAATDPVERVQGWCELAASEITAEVTSKGKITVSAQPLRCAFGTAQAACEAACTGKPECATTDVAARCDPSLLSGTCSATCTGTCDGSRAAPIACTGACEGSCTGYCDGAAMSEGACSGICLGSCGGSCSGEVAPVKCDGDCTGGCSTELVAPVCREELSYAPAPCDSCGPCSDLCAVEAVRDVTCEPPGIGVTADPAIMPGTVDLLRTHLPTLWNRRGHELWQAAAELEMVGKVYYEPAEGLTPSAFGVQCVTDAQQRIAITERQLFASMEAALEVTHAVSLGSP